MVSLLTFFVIFIKTWFYFVNKDSDQSASVQQCQFISCFSINEYSFLSSAADRSDRMAWKSIENLLCTLFGAGVFVMEKLLDIFKAKNKNNWIY